MNEPMNQSTIPTPTEQQSKAVNKYDRPLATLDHNPLIAYLNSEGGVPPSKKDAADAPEVKKLFALQRLGLIRIMVTMSTLLENQQQGIEMDVQAFDARLKAHGIAPDDIFVGAMSVPFTTPDKPYAMSFGGDLENALHRAVHEILFLGRVERDAKNIDFSWHAYRDRACERECRRRGITDIDKHAFIELDGLRWRTGNLPLPPTPALDAYSQVQRKEIEDILTAAHRDWNNTKCDAEGLYIHTSHALNTSCPQHAVFVTSDRNYKRFSKVRKATNWERLQALGFPGHIMKPDEAVSYLLMVTGASLSDSIPPHP